MFEDAIVESLPSRPDKDIEPLAPEQDLPPVLKKPPQEVPEDEEEPTEPEEDGVSAGGYPEDTDLDSEFTYYCSLIKQVAATMTRSSDRKKVSPWVKKLFGPEYATPRLREKRNRYLCSLCLSMMNDELTGVFADPPPDGALTHWNELPEDEFVPAAWERDTMWEEMLAETGDQDEVPPPCNFHDDETDPCPDVGPVTDQMLDDEFSLFLHLCRPYAAMMPSADERTKTAAWLQALQHINRNACPTMKGLRNDYIQALLGCAYDLRTAGPFVEYPPDKGLLTLIDAAKMAANAHNTVTDPSCKEAEEFMRTQPIPKEGAFCYLAITGDIQGTSIPGLLKKRSKTPPRTSLPLSLDRTTTRAKPGGNRSPAPSSGSVPYELEELFKKDRRRSH